MAMSGVPRIGPIPLANLPFRRVKYRAEPATPRRPKAPRPPARSRRSRCLARSGDRSWSAARVSGCPTYHHKQARAANRGHKRAGRWVDGHLTDVAGGGKKTDVPVRRTAERAFEDLNGCVIAQIVGYPETHGYDTSAVPPIQQAGRLVDGLNHVACALRRGFHQIDLCLGCHCMSPLDVQQRLARPSFIHHRGSSCLSPESVGNTCYWLAPAVRTALRMRSGPCAPWACGRSPQSQSPAPARGSCSSRR